MSLEEAPTMLSEETRTEAPKDPDVHLCVFRVGQEEMVLDIMRIREIMRPLPITPLPHAPEGVRGLIHVRGAVIPLMDMRLRFGLPSEETSPRQRIMVVLDHRRLWGLLMDQVQEVIRVPRSQLRSGAAIFGGRARDIFSGVCDHRGRLLLMLNLARFLSTEARVSIPALPPAALLNKERT